MLIWAIIKSFDSTTYTATVQPSGSIEVWTSVPTSRAIPAAEMATGRAAIIAIPNPAAPTDAMIVAVK
jgi:hypothetical protein